ncbi:Fur-regulated basic protein FbpA [Oceanobacillus iheyensis]|uniref:Fur-regulated basic protein FbpA n=1 Tax=Oceanobacillus iheyensis TaxID=182710 RepID=UPI003639AF70
MSIRNEDETEQRRNDLIEKLIASNLFKKGNKHLYELTTAELEYEYFKLQYDDHPHASLGSIRWQNF